MNEETAILNLRNFIRLKHLSISTEDSYAYYVGCFMRFIRKLPDGLSSEEKFERWLSSLAVVKDVSASTQNVAFNAVRFFYLNILKKPLKRVDALRAKRPVHYRNAHPAEDVLRLLDAVEQGWYPFRLVLQICYERGLREDEPLNFRLRDVDVKRRIFIIRQAKGFKYRLAPIPPGLLGGVLAQIKVAEAVWRQDVANGVPVKLPHRQGVKNPSARFSRNWAWLFPQLKPCKDPRTGEMVRWHLLADTLARACKRACRKTGLEITPHELRHSFGTDLLDAGVPMPLVSKAMGHKQIETTSGYYHGDVLRVPSPVEIAARRQSVVFVPPMEPARLEFIDKLTTAEISQQEAQ